jgi:Zeta toxin
VTRSDGWDTELYFEAALDIIGSLMAWYTAQEQGAEHDPAVAASWRDRYSEYLAEFATLDPADRAAVARAIRTCGTRLADLGGSIEVVTRPDPDAYRLSASEHARIFADRIVPDTLSTRGTQDAVEPAARPTAVIVAGEPGSGKTTQVRREAPARRASGGCAVIDPEALLSYHPRSWDLVLHDDPAAADRVTLSTSQPIHGPHKRESTLSASAPREPAQEVPRRPGIGSGYHLRA